MRRPELPVIHGAGVLVAAGVLLGSARTHAAPCARPDVLDAFPPDGARGVATNAILRAHYNSSAEHLGEDVKFGMDGELENVVADFSPNEGFLTIRPPDGLEPNETYTIVWPGLRGFNTASKGEGLTVHFTTGEDEDVERPRFDGAQSVEWDIERERDDCTDRVEDRYVFDIRVGDARDDGGRASLSLLVYQTKGPNVRASKPVAVTPVPDDGTVRVRRAVRDAVGDVCFAVVARDLAPVPDEEPEGNISASGHVEACTHTVAPPFFNGCHVTPRGSRPSFLLVLLVLGTRVKFLSFLKPLRSRIHAEPREMQRSPRAGSSRAAVRDARRPRNLKT